MRHALVRLWRLVGVDVKWFCPEGHPAIFDITKQRFHNVLQGVSKPGTTLRPEHKEMFERWTEANLETFWSEGAIDSRIIVIDDPQRPSQPLSSRVLRVPQLISRRSPSLAPPSLRPHPAHPRPAPGRQSLLPLAHPDRHGAHRRPVARPKRPPRRLAVPLGLHPPGRPVCRPPRQEVCPALDARERPAGRVHAAVDRVRSAFLASLPYSLLSRS